MYTFVLFFISIKNILFCAIFSHHGLVTKLFMKSDCPKATIYMSPALDHDCTADMAASEKAVSNYNHKKKIGVEAPKRLS